MTATNHYNDSDSIPQENKSTLAPSEKHLEDWIVANLDQFGDLGMDGNFQLTDEVYPFVDRLVERQLALTCGYPDLIGTNDEWLTVIELKKRRVDYDTLGQCLRYMQELEEIRGFVWGDAISEYNPDHDAYRYQPPIQHYIYGGDPQIKGLIVGHSVEDKHLVGIASGCNIDVATYKYVDGKYKFTYHAPNDRPHYTVLQSYVETKIGAAMRMAILTHARHWQRVQADTDELSGGAE